MAAPEVERELLRRHREMAALLESHRRLRMELEASERYGKVATFAACVFFLVIFLKEFGALP